MTEPLQMVDPGSDATQAERELIAAGRGVKLPHGDRARIWASVAAACVATEAGVAAAAVATSTSASAGPTSVLSALASWKGVVLLAVLGGSVATYQLSRPRSVEPRPVAAPPGHPAATGTAPRAEPGTQPEVPAAPAATAVKPTAPAPSRTSAARPLHPAAAREPTDDPARSATSRLAEESRAVIAARRALRAGDPASCLRLLEEAHAAFPDGSLAQEREALTIQALASSGQRDLAARRAARFLREHPESPHAADLSPIAP